MNYNLKQRTFQFAIDVAKAVLQLSNTMVNRVYIGQVLRSSSSVGANYSASQRAKSDRDFINKLKIVEEEADETVYFLRLLAAINEDHSQVLEPLIMEGTELLKITVASINKRRTAIKKL